MLHGLGPKPCRGRGQCDFHAHVQLDVAPLGPHKSIKSLLMLQVINVQIPYVTFHYNGWSVVGWDPKKWLVIIPK